MSMHDETDQSALSANKSDSKDDGAVPNHKQHNPIDFLIVTNIYEESYKFQWTIRQFSRLPKDEVLYSTDINDSSDSSYRLKLVKYEHGFGLFHGDKGQKSKTCEEPVHFGNSFCFSAPVPEEPNENLNLDDSILGLDYLVSAIDSCGKELMKWSASFSAGFPLQSCKIGEYMNNSMKMLPDDSLILNCNLKVISKPNTEKIRMTYEPSLKSNGWKKLSTDMKTLYQDSLNSDVTLVVGNDKINAHKSILMARSNVFKKIFHHDMKEAKQNCVPIADIEFSALQRLVEFLYTGVIAENESLNLQELYELYYAADKYEVVDLREMVGNTLLQNIQVDNASEILVWADRHNDKDLKSRIMNFISVNYVVIVTTDAWESFSLNHPVLAVEFFSFCTEKLKISEN